MDVRNPAQGKSITAPALGLHQSPPNKPTSFVLETRGHAGKEFDVVVTSPTGAAVPVKCYQQKDGNMLVEFVPGVAGEWLTRTGTGHSYNVAGSYLFSHSVYEFKGCFISFPVI